uniref:UPAR/Ly6 domain-containing protein n=1 Tax=Plectus sambesii TaxID=2011161 RepID=A0A914VIL0_9BILA
MASCHFSIVAFATLTTYSLALRCYQGYGNGNGNAALIHKQHCNVSSNYCVKATAIGVTVYACDADESIRNKCQSIGNQCVNKSKDGVTGTLCCCNSNLCNAAAILRPHIPIGMTAVVVTLLFL